MIREVKKIIAQIKVIQVKGKKDEYRLIKEGLGTYQIVLMN